MSSETAQLQATKPEATPKAWEKHKLHLAGPNFRTCMVDHMSTAHRGVLRTGIICPLFHLPTNQITFLDKLVFLNLISEQCFR